MQLQGEHDFSPTLNQIGQQGIDEDDNSHHLKKFFDSAEDVLHAFGPPHTRHEVTCQCLHADEPLR